MKSKILNTSLITFIIIISAIFLLFALKTGTPVIQKQRLTLASKYAESHQSSYLWQLSFIEPNKNNMNLLLDQLVAFGDIKSAKLINFWVRDQKFNLKVVENSILNQNKYNHLRYFEALESSEKEEINYFIKMVEGKFTKPTYERPTTNLGKIVTMIYRDDFNLYTVENTLGTKIEEQVDTYQNTSEQRVAVANIFLNFGFPQIALR